MKNKFILLFVENIKTYQYCCKAEAQRIKQVVHVEHFAVKHTASEHFRYGIKRVAHKRISENLARKIELVNMVENRGEIEKKHAEYFVKIFDILEENFKCAEDKSNTHAKYKKNCNGNKNKENIGCDVRRLLREEAEINYETGKNQKRNQEGYEC